MYGCMLLQVVLLGAGMDTRAWRINLPPGTSWYELDQADLLAAKVAALDALGAQQEVAGQPGRLGVAGQLWGLVRQARWLIALRWAGLVAWWKKDAVLQEVVKFLNDRVSGRLPSSPCLTQFFLAPDRCRTSAGGRVGGWSCSAWTITACTAALDGRVF